MDHTIAINHLTAMHHCIIIAVWLAHAEDTSQWNTRMPVDLD
jgi:hypothetical protein